MINLNTLYKREIVKLRKMLHTEILTLCILRSQKLFLSAACFQITDFHSPIFAGQIVPSINKVSC